jgi:hypothetical protein
MRDALFRTIRWNCHAAGRMMTTHRNERELRTNLLIAIGQVLDARRRFWLPAPIGRTWPDRALCIQGGQQPTQGSGSDANRIIPLADRRRPSDSVASQGQGQ